MSTKRGNNNISGDRNLKPSKNKKALDKKKKKKVRNRGIDQSIFKNIPSVLVYEDEVMDEQKRKLYAMSSAKLRTLCQEYKVVTAEQDVMAYRIFLKQKKQVYVYIY